MKVGVVSLLQVLVLVLGLCVRSSSLASFGDQQRNRRKSVLPTEASSSLVLNRVGSSIAFPVHGNVYPIGFYNVTLNIGQPSKPYFLDPDTGSDLTWLQCDAPCVHCTEALHPLYRPNNNLVPCNDPLCKSLHPTGDHKCETPGQCDYEIQYADGGSSLGVLVKDAFSLNFTNGIQLKPHLALGCGYDQISGPSPHPFDGVLGLGKGKSSIGSQLSRQGLVRHVIGHCLSSRGGGYLFFGDDIYDSSRTLVIHVSEHYSPGFAELMFGGKTTGIKNLLIIFDSGSSYTYLNSQAYGALMPLVKREAEKSLKQALDDRTLPFCWRGRRPFKSLQDVRKYFKTLALSFTNGGKSKIQFELPPEAYLIISSKGNVCLGILNGTEAGQTVDIIGDISMQDKMVIFDNEKQLIGWMAANCDRLPKSKAVRI
ncbi:Aspartic proteinase Asp1 [Morella rubra]|uniref:Aspartic proteinase Asp1 n=1 Tax=Morella rubra TaxID=262757 RepID=A0A6A1VF95_9ROSI|nr:Aspartic proteinase Asp1 [Morella rubra]